MDGYTESQKKIITTAHTAVAFVVIIALVAMIAWFVLKGLSIASRAVIPVATGFFLALFFKPYYLWLEKIVKIPVVALLLLIVTVVFPIGLLVWWTGEIIVNEVAGLVKQMPVMVGRALDWIESSFPNFHAVLEQLKLACGWLSDSMVNFVGTTPQVDASMVGANGNQVAAACVNCGDAISNTVAATLNADTTNMVQICTNANASVAPTTAGGMNLTTEKLGELYATYGDQIKKVGTDIIQAGYDKFGHAAAGGGGAVAAGTSAGSSAVSAGHSSLGWAYAGASGVMMKIGAGAAAVLQWFVYVLVTAIFFVYFLMTKNFCGGKIADAIPMLKEKTRKLVANQIDSLKIGRAHV